MASIIPYLNFKGVTEEAFNLYLSVFGGEILSLQRYQDNPDTEKVPESERGKIMHASLRTKSGNVLMATDVLESMGPPFIAGNNFYLSVNAGSEEEATTIFNALSAGGVPVMPLQKTFWGAFFGMVNDRFGIQWMVNFDYNQ